MIEVPEVIARIAEMLAGRRRIVLNVGCVAVQLAVVSGMRSVETSIHLLQTYEELERLRKRRPWRRRHHLITVRTIKR